jgi:hypothetical protein
MHFRWRLLALISAASLALGVSLVPGSAASSSSAALTVSHSRTDHARFERVTSFHAGSAAPSSSSSAFFSADTRVNADLPKDVLPMAGSAPTASASQTTSSGRATSAFGLNARDQGVTHGFDVEPPDQGMCAGNGSVLEIVNLVMKVYSQSNFSGVNQAMALETFFGQPFAFGITPGTDITVQGDPKCYFDAATQRWFISQLDIDFTTNTSKIWIAVSQSADPTGSYNLFSIDNTDPQNPCCPCFGDQPLLGANADAIFLSTNEFSMNNPVFNGAILYTVDKRALVKGAASPNLVVDTIGLDRPTPDGVCCWYSIQPATAPAGTKTSDVEYALSALDFVNAGDNRVAVWAFSNTSSIRSDSPAIQITETEVTTTARYIFPGFNAPQAPGVLPLQKCIAVSGCSIFTKGTKVPEGAIATNDDRMNQTVFANGLLWSGVNTAVNVDGTTQAGIAYFVVRPHFSDLSLSGSGVVAQGYVAPKGADVVFPSIGVTSTGKAIMTFTLTGPNNWPSSAYTTMSASAGAGPVTIAVAGASPQDGFSEYQDFGDPFFSPRWGDYSAAVADGSTIFFAAEVIQYPNCDYSQFHRDPTCGGTRDPFANWGTSLSKVAP